MFLSNNKPKIQEMKNILCIEILKKQPNNVEHTLKMELIENEINK